jgi:hypothetical protein
MFTTVFKTVDYFLNHKNKLQLLKQALDNELEASIRMNWLYLYRAIILISMLAVPYITRLQSRMPIDNNVYLFISEIWSTLLILLLINMIVEACAGFCLGVFRRVSIIRKSHEQIKKTKYANRSVKH